MNCQRCVSGGIASVVFATDGTAACSACEAVAAEQPRVTLTVDPNLESRPVCDICQEKPGVSFCVQDRSLMCVMCDIATHNSTPQAKKHDRFFTGASRVGLCPVTAGAAAPRSTRTAAAAITAPKPPAAPKPAAIQQVAEEPASYVPVAEPQVALESFDFTALTVPDMNGNAFEGFADFDEFLGFGAVPEMGAGKRKAGADAGAKGPKAPRIASFPDLVSLEDGVVPQFF